jgi:hypothetical protein
VIRITRATYVDVTVNAPSVKDAERIANETSHESEWEPHGGWDGYRVEAELAPVGEFGEPDISERAPERIINPWDNEV